MKRYEILREKGYYVSGCRFSGSGSVFGGAALPWARDPETKLSQLGGFNPFGPPRGLRGLALDGCSAICPGCRPGPVAVCRSQVCSGCGAVLVVVLFRCPSCSVASLFSFYSISVFILLRLAACPVCRSVLVAVLSSCHAVPLPFSSGRYRE